MIIHRINSRRSLTLASASAMILASSATSAAAFQDAPIIQPGAPGEISRTLNADEASKIADNRYSPDDVRFMQNMIPHHFQAVQMAALVKDRTNSKEVIDIAGRIDAAQADEIKFMQDWLKERGEKAPDPGAHQGEASTHHGAKEGTHAETTHMTMVGMASPAQMQNLAAVKATAFDRQFLTLMITHHEGAITMVENLLKQPGSAYDPVLFKFVNDIVNDQTSEIERMNELLSNLSEDPRALLKGGFENAESAAKNMTLVASLPKPPGFFDAQNPAGTPPKIEAKKDKNSREDDQSNEETEWGERSPLLSFANTDMAFVNDKLVTGSYHGFNIYQLSDDAAPNLISSVVCPGGQGDVSIVGDLLIMSVEQTRGRVDCGLQGVSDEVSDERFRGLRIFNISDISQPVQVGQVQTCRGSHTHTIVSGPGRNGKIIVYNSGTSSIRKEEELEGCVGAIPGDNRTALFSIDVIEIPVDDPSKARIIDSPRVFADQKTGQIAGLWKGGDHGEGTQETRPTTQCHDITIFPAAKIAAGACAGNGIIFDISNPRKPKRIDDVKDSGFAYWHSATFNNDGTKVLFTDEWGGGSRPRCRAYDPQDWGADAIYDIKDGKLEFKSYYKMSAPQSEKENCVAHNGSVIPVPGRDIFVQAWYQGGVSVIDFTDSSKPVEIAYFDRGAVHEEVLILAGYWSTYWYDGKIYGTEIARGLDIFELSPSEFLTSNELAAAKLGDQGAAFNPQQQFPVSWPAEPVIARAYIDQLKRDDAISAQMLTDLSAALDKAETVTGKDTGLAKQLATLGNELGKNPADAIVQKRLTSLSATLKAIAKKMK